MKKRVVARPNPQHGHVYHLQKRRFGIWVTVRQERKPVQFDSKQEAFAALSYY